MLLASRLGAGPPQGAVPARLNTLVGVAGDAGWRPAKGLPLATAGAGQREPRRARAPSVNTTVTHSPKRGDILSFHLSGSRG